MTAPTPLSDASVWRINGLTKSGFRKTGEVHSISFNSLNASSHFLFQQTLLGDDFLVKSVNGTATLV